MKAVASLFECSVEEWGSFYWSVLFMVWIMSWSEHCTQPPPPPSQLIPATIRFLSSWSSLFYWSKLTCKELPALYRSISIRISIIYRSRTKEKSWNILNFPRNFPKLPPKTVTTTWTNQWVSKVSCCCLHSSGTQPINQQRNFQIKTFSRILLVCLTNFSSSVSVLVHLTLTITNCGMTWKYKILSTHNFLSICPD